MGAISKCPDIEPRLAIGDLGAKASEWIVGVFDLLQAWQERARQRRQLAALDDRMLRDIGVSTSDVEHETRKWFWQ